MFLATELASRIVGAGDGLVRRVTMVGSRAHGTARPDSDLDMIVLVEPPGHEAPWQSSRVLAEKARIQAAAGTPPLLTDLWLRTTDQFAEASAVFGTIEALIESEGVDLYRTGPTRAPVVRRSREIVQRDCVRSWLEDALDQAARAAQSGSCMSPARRHPRTYGEARYAERSVQRAVMAACVLHGVVTSTNEVAPSAVWSALARVDREIATIAPDLFGAPYTSLRAAVVLASVVTYVQRIAAMRPHLGDLPDRVRRLVASGGAFGDSATPPPGATRS